MTTYEYAVVLTSATEIVAVAAAIFYKVYKTKFGFILFLFPLSSLIADSMIIYNNYSYMPIGMIYHVFSLFNSWVLFKAIQVFSRKELKLILLAIVIFSCFIVHIVVKTFQTQTPHPDVFQGISSIFIAFVGTIGTFRLIKKADSKKNGISYYFQAIVSVTIFYFIMFTPLIGFHLIYYNQIDASLCSYLLIWCPLANIFRNIILIRLFFVGRQAMLWTQLNSPSLQEL